MINAIEEKRMTQVEEHALPVAFARTVDVDSTFAYMGSLMTFLDRAKHDVAVLLAFAPLECARPFVGYRYR